MNLYTKYRSQQFKEVVGQEQVVRVLINAIKLDRVGHAYLFSGPRGTGKTTLARLLAKSLNCMDRKKGEVEPCGKCDSCREINLGTSMDIIEIDAASNRGIDEIRALRDKVRFVASGTRYKVFIIDEVHMLTREAFNALLKTLEEPPKHVVFIMATTEVHKVPETIMSRTMSFDFSLHKLPDIIKQLEMIAKKEKITVDEQSVRLIAQNAKGGMRDAITILDQVSASSKKIDEKLTREVLGLSSFESLALSIRFILQKDAQKALKLLEKLSQDGVDIYQYNIELVSLAQKIMLYKAGLESALDVFTKEERNTIARIVKNVGDVEMVEIVKQLLQATNETKNSEIAELPLELAIVQLTRKDAELTRKDAELTRKDAEKMQDDMKTSRPFEDTQGRLATLPRSVNEKEEKIDSSAAMHISIKNRRDQNDNHKKSSHPEAKTKDLKAVSSKYQVASINQKLKTEIDDKTSRPFEDTQGRLATLPRRVKGEEEKETSDKTQETSDKRPVSTAGRQEINNRQQETNKTQLSNSKSQINLDINKIKDKWPEFLGRFAKENGLKTFLENSKPVKIENEKLRVAVQFKFYKDALEKSKNYQKFVKKFEELFKNSIAIKFVVDGKLVKQVKGAGSDSSDSVLAGDAEEVFG